MANSKKIKKIAQSDRYPIWVFVAAVIVISIIVHLKYIHNGFTWLDHIDIEYQKAILPLSDWTNAFLTRYGETGFFRPVITLMHSLDYALYGSWAPGFHITNILLHSAVVAAAFFFFIEFLAFNSGEAFVAALLLAIHPISWLPVGAISYRPELLVSIFVLSAVIFHAKARKSGKAVFILLAAVSFFLGLCAKETALVWLPGLIGLWEWRNFKQSKQHDQTTGPKKGMKGSTQKAGFNAKALPFWGKKPGVLLGGEFLMLAVYLTLRFHAVPDLWHTSPVSLSLSEALGTRLAVLGKQLLMLISPLKPPLSDATPVVGFFAFSSLLTLLMIIAAGVILYRARFSFPWVLVIGFLILALAPALNLVPLPRFSSPHYGYFALLGIGMLVPLTWRVFRNNAVGKKTFPVLIGLWFAFMAAVTFVSGKRFQNDYTLFQPEVKKDPNFLEAHYYLGDYFMKKGEFEQAAKEYEAALVKKRAIIAYVDRTATMINLAGIRIRQNRLDQAEELLTTVAEKAAKDRQPLIAYNLATIAAKQQDFTRVISLLNRPDYRWHRPEPLLLLARALRRANRTQEALSALRKSLPLLNPEKRKKLQEFILSQQSQ